MSGEYPVQITLLVDNVAEEGLIREHGLSLWIETPEKRILFDTGQGRALSTNAKKLGINVDTADALVISHEHYDHTGGISTVIENAKNLDIYCPPGVLQPQYCMPDGTQDPRAVAEKQYVTIPMRPAVRLHWISRSIMISPRIGIAALISQNSNASHRNNSLTESVGKDELTLWIVTEEGIVVCVGCCHNGLNPTLAHVLRMSGSHKIKAVIGGFHWRYGDDAYLEGVVLSLRSFTPEILIPCHCTGERALRALRTLSHSKVLPGYAGFVYHF